MKSEIQELLEGFGFDTHTAHLITGQAHRHELTPEDITAWIEEADRSRTILNPRGFIRARITSGDKPPRPGTSRSRHAGDGRYHSQFLCPTCRTRPCICQWDPKQETLSHFRERIMSQATGETS